MTRDQGKIRQMRRAFFILIPAIKMLAAGVLAAALAAPAFAGSDDSTATPLPFTCGSGIPGGMNCIPSKQDLKDARNAYTRGVKLEEHQHSEAAFEQFDEAARLAPDNLKFLTAREATKSELVFSHVERGNALLANNLQTQAAMEFRVALSLDPENEFARQRLADATRDSAPVMPQPMPMLDSGEIHLQPKNTRTSFHFRGDTKALFAELASAYGITPQFDESVQSKRVRFFVDDVDFFTALKLASEVTKTMWSALDSRQMLLASDTPENHKQFDRMSLRTFILPAHSTPQEATDLVTAMRNMFDLRFVSSGQTSDTVEVRGPQPMLEACAKLMAQLTSGERPQVLLEVSVYQINHQLTKNIGLHVPNTFNAYNIPAVALAGLGGQSIQQLINQLISSGGINQAGSTAISGLLAQLQSEATSIFSQPLATFGGGLSFSGVSLDQLALNLSVNESWVRSLEHMTLRASQGNDATFHLGERYPVINASFSPIANSSAISAVLGNQSYIAPFPSVSYEDLGLNMKAKPTVHGNGDVSLALEFQVRSLTGQSTNGVPVISNREFKGSINLRDGEPVVVAGEVSETDTRSMSGIPGFGFIPLLNQAMVNNTVEKDNDELLIVLTPHVLSNTLRTTPEIWLTEK